MKVNHSVKLELSKKESDAVQTIYNMLAGLNDEEETALDDNISNGMTVADIKNVLMDIWELSEQDINLL